MGAKLEIKIVSYDELPEEIDRDWGLSNNGCGKEYADYLLLYYNGKLLRCESDAMEREDACFYRNLSWIKDAVLEAYELGKSENKGVKVSE